MTLSRIFKKNPYARMPLEEARIVIVRYSRVVAVEGACWFMPADCLPVEAPKIASALILVAADVRRRGESCRDLATLHGHLCRFSHLPDLDRANYHLRHQGMGQAHPLDEAAYVAAQDMYNQAQAELARDWHEFELNVDHMPLYGYLPKQLPLLDFARAARLIREYQAVLSSDRHVNNCRLREWLPASKQDICRALVLEYTLDSEQTKEDYEFYLVGAGILRQFLDDGPPGLSDTEGLSPGELSEQQDTIIAQNKTHMRISGRQHGGDLEYWMRVFECMVAAYEVRLGMQPLIEPEMPLATPSVNHNEDE